MAEVDSAMLNDGLENVARILCDDTVVVATYDGMGVGEDATGAASSQHDLIGAETHYNGAGDVTNAYEASYKATWVSTFLYADLATHVFEELVICESAANHLNKCLCRFTYDAITLGVGETISFTVKCTMSQGA